jgi:hypothetical protein
MPTALPNVYPLEIVERVPLIRFPSGSWLLVGWAVAMLAVGLLAGSSADTGTIDQFQLLANF